MPDLPILPTVLATPSRFLWHPDSRTAILADMHLGQAASLARAGLFVPDQALPSMRRSWEDLVARSPERLIIAGDVFDSPRIDADALRVCMELLARLPPACRVTITPGNHDPQEIGNLGLRAEVCPAVVIGSLVISHGHEVPAELRDNCTWIVGHQHPAVVVSSAVQSVKMPCYAWCTPAGRGAMLVLPAFSRGPLGSNLLTLRHWLLPVPRPGNSEIRIFGLVERQHAAEAQVLDFGPLNLLATAP